MSIKISELPQATTVNSRDAIPIVQEGITKQVTSETFFDSNFVALLVLGANAVDNSFHITNVTTAYTPLNVTTLTANKLNTKYCSYNTSNGRLTFLKSGYYKATISTQIRSSSTSSSTTPLITKGFGLRIFDSAGNVVDTGTVAEQTVLTGWSNMSGVYYFSANATDYLIPMAYSRVLSGSTSNESIVWGYGRTNILVEYVGETIPTLSINLTRSANTGKLAEIGDRVELTDEAKQDEKQVEKQVEQVKDQVENISAEPIETKTEGSGDTI